MPIDNNALEPTEDDIYLAKMTMDEVGADIEEHGHVAVTRENRTQDPFSAQGSLSEALESVIAMDAVTEVPEEADEEAHQKWMHQEIEKAVPTIPEAIEEGGKPDSNGLIYLDYTFTVDPEKYNSPNYQPIADAGKMGNGAAKAIKDPNEQAANDKVDEDVSVAETIVEAGGEPSKDAEKEAAKEANEDEKDIESIGKPIEEKKAEDEAAEKVVLDYATYIDGSSFICFDEDTGVDYAKIAMDAGPKKPVTRQTCKTTFAQCRAKNPLFCRFHGPKLLEKDIKSAISAALGKGCVVSVTKDKGQKNPLTFRLTIGCPPAMKKDVEKIVHMFMTQNPGISSPEEYKDLGNGKQTTEFDMDILKADEPPKKNDLKGQAAQWKTKQAKESGKTMPVIGETPPGIEKAVGNGEVKEEVKEEAIEGVPEKPPIEPPPQKETLADGDEKKQTETLQTPKEEVAEKPEEKEEEIDEGGNSKGEEITEGMMQAAKEKEEENVEQPATSEPIEASAESETLPNEEPPKPEETKSQVKPQKKSAKAKDGTADEIDAAAGSIAEKTGENPSAIAQGIEERIEGKKPTTPQEAEMIAAALPEGSGLVDKIKGAAKVEESKKKEEEKQEKQSRKDRNKIPVKVPNEVERVVEEAESYLKNPSGEQSLATAQAIVSAVEELKPLDDKVKSIEKVRKEKGRKTSALGRAILTKAEDEAKTSLGSAVKRIEELGTTLSDETKAERYEAELASKSQVRDKVEGVLSSLKSRMFTVGKDGKTIADVSGVVSATMDDIASYGSELGLDEDVVDNIVKSSRLGILGAELKASSSDMDEAVTATKEALGKTGADFHIEDAEHLSGEAMRAISSTGRAFANLRAVANRVKDMLANAKKVAEAKEKLGGEKIDIEHVRSRIEKVYKDWVEDDVPGWVGEMTEANQAAYADILEKAQHSGGMDNGASLDALDAFEKKHMRDGAKKRAAEAEKEEKTDSGEAVGKPDREESTIPKEARKQALEAAKRLGVDAYKPTDELRKMAIILKPRTDGNPRLEQRLKDLETVLADREAKKDLVPKEMGKYVGDESPNRQIVMDILVEALSNK